MRKYVDLNLVISTLLSKERSNFKPVSLCKYCKLAMDPRNDLEAGLFNLRSQKAFHQRAEGLGSDR